MRRCAVLLGLGALLLAGSLQGVQAQQISIANDPSSAEMPMEISLRDADLVEVLAAMANSTNNRYQIRVDDGVVGRIARLQLSAKSFEQALDTVLAGNYGKTKSALDDGSILFKISSRRSAPALTTGGGGINFAPPSKSVSAVTNYGGSSSTSAVSSLSLLSYNAKSSDTTKTVGGAASNEVTVIKMIQVANLDLANLAEKLGGTYIELFVQSDYGYGDNGGSSSSSSGSSNRNSRWNDNNNDNSYNNNSNRSSRYNNDNNSSSRTTRSSRYNNNNNNNNYQY